MTLAVNFISSKESSETLAMHTKSDNIEITIVKEIKLLKNFLNLFCKDKKNYFRSR